MFMKQKTAFSFLIMCCSLATFPSLQTILDEWTREKLLEVTSSLPHIAGSKSPVKTCNILLDIKEIPAEDDKTDDEKIFNNYYWKDLSGWELLFSPEKVKAVFEKAIMIFEHKQQYFLKKRYIHQFFRKGYQFDKEDEIHVIGDLHGGGLHDIQTFIEGKVDYQLQIIDERNHFVFLGDMVDGGLYSLETLYFINLLFLKNRKNIHIIRGNHEALEMNKDYGFCYELLMKYKDMFPNTKELEFFTETFLQQYIEPFYAKLPVVLFGVFPDSQLIIPFCHGTIDLHDQEGARYFLRSFLKKIQKEKAKEYYEYFFTSHGGDVNGYQWNDCILDGSKKTKNSGRDQLQGILKIVGKKDTEAWLERICPDTYNAPFIMRAHQHSIYMENLMPFFFGHYLIAFLWDDNPLVFTLCVNPGSGFSLPQKDIDPQYSFPGILHSTTVIISDAARKIDIIRHPNMHIKSEIKEMHKKILLEHITEEKDNFPEEYYQALSDDFDVYLKQQGIDEDNATEDDLKAFLAYVINVEQEETIATFSYNPKIKRMQLALFYLPKLLREILSPDQIEEIHEKRKYHTQTVPEQTQELPEITITNMGIDNNH
jgi:hypothetical protein